MSAYIREPYFRGSFIKLKDAFRRKNFSDDLLKSKKYEESECW